MRTLLFVTLLLLATPAFSQHAPDTLIVPGVRIGPAALTMTVDEMVRMLGEPATWYEGIPYWRTRTQPGVLVLDWTGPKGLALGTRDDRDILTIYTCGTTRYRTATGLKHSDPSGTVALVYGKPTTTILVAPFRLAIYDHLGLAASLGQVVGCIFVFRPNTAQRIWKF